MANTKDKVLAFTSYLSDQGHIWSSKEEAVRDGDEFLVTIIVTFQRRRFDGEVVECSVSNVVRTNVGIAYGGSAYTDEALLHLLMLAFGQDPSVEHS